MEISELHSLFLKTGGVTTDSRAIKGGEMFIALKGENFDGNEYAQKALEAGAAYAVVNEGSKYAGTDERIIAFPDTLKALTDLARYHRENTFVNGERLTVIGLTGTNGKTTTKNLIREVLATKYKVTATEGNLNNDIGVPLSLLKINSGTEIAVIEMGANHPDDIEKLVKVAEPDYGLITNVGKAHLLGFGSFEGVKAAKGKLYDWIAENGKAVFLNADDADLCEMVRQRGGLSMVSYGVNEWKTEVIPSDPEHPYLRIAIPVGNETIDTDSDMLYVVESNLVGAYNAGNVLAAIAVGHFFGVELSDAFHAIHSFVPSNNRSQMVRTERNSLIVDAYNANPTSMAAALDNFAMAISGNKVALLGDMRELGEDSVAEHVAIVEKVKGMDIAKVCYVGEEFHKALESAGTADNAMWFESSEALAAYLADNALEGALVLVKGSRGIQMEKTIPQL